MRMDMLGGPQDMSITADGAIEFDTQRATMTMKLGAMGQQLGMGEVEMIIEAQTIYMKFPNHQQIGLPTPWVKMGLNAMAEAQGRAGLSQLNSNDPARAMEMLRGVSGEVEELGTEDIRGCPRPTTRPPSISTRRWRRCQRTAAPPSGSSARRWAPPRSRPRSGSTRRG